MLTRGWVGGGLALITLWLFFWVGSVISPKDWYAPPLMITIFLFGVCSIAFAIGGIHRDSND